MLNLKPEYLSKNGRREFVVLTVEQYKMLTEALEDAQDLKDLRAARARNAGKPTITLEQMKQELARRRSTAKRRTARSTH
jgi:PHD/YefM family antitoxin component YafN of YafNO toxin-antitoxin module